MYMQQVYDLLGEDGGLGLNKKSSAREGRPPLACWACGKGCGERPRRCPGCSTAVYCNSTCGRAHRKDHKAMCSRYARAQSCTTGRVHQLQRWAIEHDQHLAELVDRVRRADAVAKANLGLPAQSSADFMPEFLLTVYLDDHKDGGLSPSHIGIVKMTSLDEDARSRVEAARRKQPDMAVLRIGISASQYILCAVSSDDQPTRLGSWGRMPDCAR